MKRFSYKACKRLIFPEPAPPRLLNQIIVKAAYLHRAIWSTNRTYNIARVVKSHSSSGDQDTPENFEFHTNSIETFLYFP